MQTHLQHHNEEKQSHRYVDLKSGHHHAAAAQLAQQVDEHKDGGQELAAAPAHVHVLPLLVPLDVHAQAVLEERGDEAQTGHCGQHIFAALDDLQK